MDREIENEGEGNTETAKRTQRKKVVRKTQKEKKCREKE